MCVAFLVGKKLPHPNVINNILVSIDTNVNASRGVLTPSLHRNLNSRVLLCARDWFYQ